MKKYAGLDSSKDADMIAEDLLIDTYGQAPYEGTDPLLLLTAIDHGVPVSILKEVQVGFGLADDEIAAVLHVNPRTIKRLESSVDVLRPDLAERVVFLKRLMLFAAAVLGGLDAVRQYIRRPIMAMDGKRPLDYLTTLYGIQLVYDEVGRIEHGIY